MTEEEKRAVVKTYTPVLESMVNLTAKDSSLEHDPGRALPQDDGAFQ